MPSTPTTLDGSVHSRWTYTDGDKKRGEFIRLEDGRWEELKEGKHWAYFAEVRRTEDAVELYDKGRSLSLRVGPRQALFSTDGKTWNVLFDVEPSQQEDSRGAD
jgi:hypothetical protein